MVNTVRKIICAFLVCVAVYRCANAVEPQTRAENHHQVSAPRYEMMGKVEVMFQAPKNPSGVLLVLHGCSHSATDFFVRSLQCPQCLGLPEELNITREALSRGWAILAVSSADRRGRRCWRPSPPDPAVPVSEDTINVKHVLRTWLGREGLLSSNTTTALTRSKGSTRASTINTLSTPPVVPSVPLFALGASSGGAFAMFLAMHQDVHFSGVCSIVMAVPQALLFKHVHSHKADGVKPAFPPTIFVHMEKDVRTVNRVRMNKELLSSQGIPVKEVALPPRPLTPDHLYKTCAPEVSLPQSHAINESLSKSGVIGPDGYLKLDPRQSMWRKALEKVPGIDSIRLQADASPISEELNMLWARHEIVSSPEMFEFFEQQKAASFHI